LSGRPLFVTGDVSDRGSIFTHYCGGIRSCSEDVWWKNRYLAYRDWARNSQRLKGIPNLKTYSVFDLLLICQASVQIPHSQQDRYFMVLIGPE